MDFNNEFNKLSKKYNLSYSYQRFEKCFNGNWTVLTYSLYNETGCFTVQYLPQREEVDCYFSETFDVNRKVLCNKPINIFETEKEVWRKKEKIWIFKNLFYYWNPDRVIKTLIEVIEISIKKDNAFFGVELNISKNSL